MLYKIAWSAVLNRLQRSAMLDAVGQSNRLPGWEARVFAPLERHARQDRLERDALQTAAERNALRSRAV